jgi:hypothetical protein
MQKEGKENFWGKDGAAQHTFAAEFINWQR